MVKMLFFAALSAATVGAITCPLGEYEQSLRNEEQGKWYKTGTCLECKDDEGSFDLSEYVFGQTCEKYSLSNANTNDNKWCEVDVSPMHLCPQQCQKDCQKKYDFADFGAGECPEDMHIIHSAGFNPRMGSNYGECVDMCLPDFTSWDRFLSMVISNPIDKLKLGKGPCRGMDGNGPYQYVIRSSPVWIVKWTGVIGQHNFTDKNPYSKRALNMHGYSRSPDVNPGSGPELEQDGFDFSRCGGVGSFSKTFGDGAEDTNIFIGMIKKGATEVMINLTSTNGDLDIQLFDPKIPTWTDSVGQVMTYKDQGKAVIAWCKTLKCNIAPIPIMQQSPVYDYFYDPTGALANDCTQHNFGSKDEYWKCDSCHTNWEPDTKIDCKDYSPEGMYFNYSGYQDVGDPEYIYFPEVTTNLIMKAYAYIPGRADVKYTFGGQNSACCRGEEMCTGSFNRRIQDSRTQTTAIDTVEIGRIPVGVRNLTIELRTEIEEGELGGRDVDIQLFDEEHAMMPAPADWVPGAKQDAADAKTGYPEGLALVAWCMYTCNHGFLQGPDYEFFTWKNAFYTWSGYYGIESCNENGESCFRDAGYERITVDVVTTPLMMKAFAYEEGTAAVTYSYWVVPDYEIN